MKFSQTKKTVTLDLDDLAEALRATVVERLMEAEGLAIFDALTEACISEAYEYEIQVVSPKCDDNPQFILTVVPKKSFDDESCGRYNLTGQLCLMCVAKKAKFESEQREIVTLSIKEPNNAYANASIKGGVNFNG